MRAVPWCRSPPSRSCRDCSAHRGSPGPKRTKRLRRWRRSWPRLPARRQSCGRCWTRTPRGSSSRPTSSLSCARCCTRRWRRREGMSSRRSAATCAMGASSSPPLATPRTPPPATCSASTAASGCGGSAGCGWTRPATRRPSVAASSLARSTWTCAQRQRSASSSPTTPSASSTRCPEARAPTRPSRSPASASQRPSSGASAATTWARRCSGRSSVRPRSLWPPPSSRRAESPATPPPSPASPSKSTAPRGARAGARRCRLRATAQTTSLESARWPSCAGCTARPRRSAGRGWPARRPPTARCCCS
mmetsp:Transcript_26188/g.84062  ORF Transcript_26188/g.84062 Transcript_26188/m.84062 type:complete len:306 (-) Transcript_26188:425-1342(-)